MPKPKEIVARIRRMVDMYDAQLDALDLPPNGDDYNEIVEGIRHILAGGTIEQIVVITEGR
jgi:hypothetical protein